MSKRVLDAFKNPSSVLAHIFWGKISADASVSLPLPAHCLDVALVFRGLCDLVGVRRSLNRSTDAGPLSEQQLDRLGVLAMLHDAGKANLGFQYKVFDSKAPQAGHIRELAPLFDIEALDEALHDEFLATLPADFHTWFSDGESAYSYLMATFSHHGRPLAFHGERSGTYPLARKKWWRPGELGNPMEGVAEIVRWAQHAFPDAFEPGGPALPAEPRFHHRFAGLVTLADWLGSHSDWFPVQNASLSERLVYDKKTVPRLLESVGLDVGSSRSVLARESGDFESRFGFPPRPLQATVEDLDVKDDNTRLLIAESATGSGKTEAALNWFHKLFVAGEVDSLYFALPTRVAARELYTRIHKTIVRWYPDASVRPITVLAVPGYAEVDGIPAERLLPSDEASNRWQDDKSLRRRERQWASEHPKRFLAATVAVGTIDQALLSSVQTAHAHLRSVCLDRSLLVVDEVHASDYYMSRLLENLLDHHLGIGGRAMLLSATLGANARHRFTRWTHRSPLPDLQTAGAIPYPAVTFLNGKSLATATAGQREKSVRFVSVPVAFNLDAIVPELVRALTAGARVLVVMNTVGRATALLRAVQRCPEVNPGWLFRCQGVITPHHGRFAPEDRVLLDDAVSKRLGPGSAAGPLLMIGTQTLEQSLDIDADLMISDLAPVDVLLQRVGRLHRHDRERPQGYEDARCVLLTPEGDLETALDEHGRVTSEYKQIGYGSVYEDLRMLELTRRVLTEQSVVHVPRDCRRLVEAVTHPECLNGLKGDKWERHRQEIEGGELARAIAAGHAMATFDEYFGQFEFNESGGKVAIRLGADRLQLPLDRPVTSPYGVNLKKIVIPGHMAPKEPPDTVSVEEASKDNMIVLRCAERRYHYSRYGLEEVT